MAVTIKKWETGSYVGGSKRYFGRTTSRPKTPRDGEVEAATTARNLRDKLAIDRVMLEN